MSKPEHAYLRRLESCAYQGPAVVHWVFTIDQRRRGWLDSVFHATFRELLTHLGYRFDCFCPAYCLMPDHIHLLLAGASSDSDQRLAVRWLRRHLNRCLREKGFRLQKQGDDHVLRNREREPRFFEKIVSYVFTNPERGGLIAQDGDAWQWESMGAVVPGYPELHPKADDFWEAYWKLYYRKIEGAS